MTVTADQYTSDLTIAFADGALYGNTYLAGVSNPCRSETDDVMPSVIGLLPQGPAWDAHRAEGTVPNKYWRVFASLLAAANKRLCEFVDEFFCATAKESVEQWREEYGVGGPCDPWLNNLCAKVAAVGGQSFAYFEKMALDAGWVIRCESVVPVRFIAGCARAGRPLGVRPELLVSPYPPGTCECAPAVQSSDPALWEYGKDRSQAVCPVPGSRLGLSGCCMRAGQHRFPGRAARDAYDDLFQANETRVALNGGCGTSTYYFFDCPPACVPSYAALAGDSTGKFKRYGGGAYLWRVIVDLEESWNVQRSTPEWVDKVGSFAGRSMAGCTLAGKAPAFNPVLCFLEALKPAHTIIVYETI